MKLRIAPTTLSCASCAALSPGARCPVRCERNFVLGGWSSSLKHSRDAGMITSDDWIAVMHEQIAKICARPEARVLVAADTVMLGFIAGEPAERIVYYCFVKEAYRRRGVARQLFEAFGIDPRSRFAYPARTAILGSPETMLRNKIPLAIHDPAVARYSKPDRHRSYS